MILQYWYYNYWFVWLYHDCMHASLRTIPIPVPTLLTTPRGRGQQCSLLAWPPASCGRGDTLSWLPGYLAVPWDRTMIFLVRAGAMRLIRMHHRHWYKRCNHVSMNWTCCSNSECVAPVCVCAIVIITTLYSKLVAARRLPGVYVVPSSNSLLGVCVCLSVCLSVCVGHWLEWEQERERQV